MRLGIRHGGQIQPGVLCIYRHNRRKSGVVQFTDERVTSVDVTRMIEKFEWQDFEGEVTSPFVSTITVTLTDGSTISRDVVRPMGEPGNPMSKDQIFEKYTGCVGNNKGFEVVRRSLELLERLEELKDINLLIQSLRA